MILVATVKPQCVEMSLQSHPMMVWQFWTSSRSCFKALEEPCKLQQDTRDSALMTIFTFTAHLCTFAAIP